jgi:hypothetical protein
MPCLSISNAEILGIARMIIQRFDQHFWLNNDFEAVDPLGMETCGNDLTLDEIEIRYVAA